MAGKQVLSERDDDQVAAVNPEDQQPEEVVVEEAAEPTEVVEDERTAHADADEEGEEGEPPQRHRESAKERRQRVKDAKERDKRHLAAQDQLIQEQNRAIAEMAEQVRKVQAEALDTRIAHHVRDAQAMEAIEVKALEQNKAQDAIDARKFKEQNNAEAQRLMAEKDRLLAPQPAAPQIDPSIAQKQQIFFSRHSWYNHTGNDEESQIVKAIDRSMAAEGRLNPRQPEYWGELERRIAERLPHRARTADAPPEEDDTPPPADTRTRRAPPVGGGRNAPAGTGTRLMLSPERVAAMKEAGYWEDPKLRKKMAEKYIAFDKARALPKERDCELAPASGSAPRPSTVFSSKCVIGLRARQ